MHSSAAGFAPGNRKPRLAKRYGQGAEVAKLDATVFFIGTGGGDEPSLYQRTLATQGGTAATMSNHALVEGVEDIQVLYGVDTDHDGSVNAYLSAAASDMSKVVSVHIALLLRTAADNLAAAPQSLRYNGGVFNAPDRRLRRVANTTIKLRNRGAR